jgi:hypothetical protein
VKGTREPDRGETAGAEFVDNAVLCAAAAAAENIADVDRMIPSWPVSFNIFNVVEGR